jgi:PKD repeat protein
MRRIYYLLLSIFSLLSISTFAQINTGILPDSFKDKSNLDNVDHVFVEPPSMELIRIEDEIDEKNGQMYKVARLLPVDLTPQNSGTWDKLSDGTDIWRLRISSEGAKSCVLHFDYFELPVGSKLFVYNPDNSVILGPYTSEDNPLRAEYAIGVLFGNEAIIEYSAPKVKSEDGMVKDPIPPHIKISAFSYFYRGESLFDNRSGKGTGYGASDDCQVNVNCSEGNNWRKQQKGVARIYVVEGYSAGYCTGSLVNNTTQDGTPYFLTADHCGGTASASNMNQWIFRFNYESPGCTATSEPSGNNITGCVKKARGPIDGGSDFLLLQLNTTALNLKNIGAVYNGWRNNNVGSSSGVSIHHPSGDIKKISTYTTALSTATWSGGMTNAHWRVYWAQTANGHGVTEGGSSGSPIFDNNGLIIGTLSGGSSYCTATNQPDLYGKMSSHWTANGTTNDQQLKPWLDPSGSATQCQLYDPNDVGLVCNFSGTPTYLNAGGTVSFTDLSTGGTITSRSWTFQGGTPSTSTSANPVITYNTPGVYNVSLTVSTGTQNATETKNGYITVVSPGSGFTYDFEACTNFVVDQFSPCTTYDGDGSASFGSQSYDFTNEGYTGSYIAFNPSATTPAATGAWASNQGSKYGACFSATTPPNNDWFITPQISLQSNSSFSFWAKSVTNQWGLERFNVYISTTNNNIGSFIKISPGSYVEAPTTWTQYTYDLNAYNGQNVYLAIQCVSNDAFAFFIDDIKINTSPSVTPPTANFSGTPTTLCNGGSVTFTDLSTNNPTSWSWSFPGGTPSTSTQQNPVVTYNTPGVYNVSLTVSNQGGNNTMTKNNYITVNNCAPTANFTGNPTVLCAGGIVNFTDQSTNNPTSWNWSFPGGTPSSSTQQNPTVVYNTPGTYSVSLTVSNGSGSNTQTKNNYITVNNCSNIDDAILSMIQIYPNPTNGILNINIPTTNAELSIINIIGNEVLKTNLNSTKNTIDLNSLNQGIYIVEIKIDGKKYRSKITIYNY